MKVVLTGGGTAGHVYPALTVAGRFAAARDEVLFAGTGDGVEARLAPEAGIPFVVMPSRGYDRGAPWTLVPAILTVLRSFLRAHRLLGSVRPDVVMGFGAYVSLPVGLAAVVRGIPLVLHEQNSVPGLANRFLSRWAKGVGVTYPGSVSRLRHADRVEVTGNPVREEVLVADRARARGGLGFAEEDLVLLVFGGSRGARHLNTATVNLHSRLMGIDGLRVLHVAGPLEAASVREALSASGAIEARWSVLEYVDDMASALAAADVVVARAGATSIAEMTAIGRAALLVPYPFATDDHQTLNARAVEEAGGAVVVRDSELDSERFGEELGRLLSDRRLRDRMAERSRSFGRRDAAEALEKLAREAAERG